MFAKKCIYTDDLATLHTDKHWKTIGIVSYRRYVHSDNFPGKLLPEGQHNQDRDIGTPL